MERKGFDLKFSATKALEQFALSPERALLPDDLDLADSTTVLYLKGLAAVHEGVPVPDHILKKLCPAVKDAKSKTHHTHDAGEIARFDLECRSILIAAGNATKPAADKAVLRLLDILKRKNALPSLDDSIQSASLSTTQHIETKLGVNTSVQNSQYAEEVFWKATMKDNDDINSFLLAVVPEARTHVWNLIRTAAFSKALKENHLESKPDDVLACLLEVSAGGISQMPLAAIPGIEAICAQYMKEQGSRSKVVTGFEGRTPEWALRNFTHEQLTKLSSAVPRVQSDAHWQSAILRRLQGSKTHDEWTREDLHSYLDRAKVFARGVQAFTKDPALSARIAWARFDSYRSSSDTTAVEFQAALLEVLEFLPLTHNLLPDTYATGIPLAALPMIPHDSTAILLDAVLHHVVHNDASQFLSDKGAVVQHTRIDKLLQAYLQVLADILLGDHTSETLNRYTEIRNSLVSMLEDSPARMIPSLTFVESVCDWHWMTCPSGDAVVTRSFVSMSACNLDEHTAASELYVHVDIKNIPQLTVKVFEINLGEFYKSGTPSGLSALQLNGFVPSKEFVHQVDPSPAKLQHIGIPIPDMCGRRGCFVIEIAGGGQSCRMVIMKGSMHHIMRHTAAGHAISLFYEDNTSADDPEIICAGKKYTLQGNNSEIMIPYRTGSTTQDVIMSAGSVARRFATVECMEFPAEEYKLLADIHVERECLVLGSEAPIIVRAKLMLHGHAAPLQVMENAALQIEVRDSDDVANSHTVKDFELQELPGQAVHLLSIPEKCRLLTVTLTARIRLTARLPNAEVQYQDLVHSTVMELNQTEDTAQIEDLHMTRLPDGQYAIRAIGRCGEGIPHVSLKLKLQHSAWRTEIQIRSHTDKNGTCALGSLAGIQKIAGHLVGKDICRVWTIKGKETSDPPMVMRLQAASKTTILPYGKGTIGSEKEGIALVKVVPGSAHLHVRNLAVLGVEYNKVKLVDGCLHVKPLPAGDYMLYAPRWRRAVHLISVAGGRDLTLGNDGYKLAGKRVLPMTAAQPVNISKLTASQTEGVRLQVQTCGDYSDVKVSVALTRFMPVASHGGTLHGLWNIERSQDFGTSWAAPKSTCLPSIAMGDEARYVMERRLEKRKSPTHPGCLLEKPSLLVDRVTAKDAAKEASLTAVNAELFGSAACAPAMCRSGVGGMGPRCHQDPRMGARGEAQSLASTPAACTLTGLDVDKDGLLIIPFSDFPNSAEGYTFVQATTISWDGAVSSATCPISGCQSPQDQAIVDLRKTSALPGTTLLSRTQFVHTCQPGDTLTVTDITNAKMNTIDSPKHLYSLYTELLGESSSDMSAAWRHFSFLPDWPSLPNAKKRSLLSSHACYELWFFIKLTDLPFFDSDVRPMLSVRLLSERDFMVHLLLDDDAALRGVSASPARVSALNGVERIFLADVLGQSEALTMTVLDGKEAGSKASVMHSTAHLARLRTLFAIALRSGGLEAPGDERFLDPSVQQAATADTHAWEMPGIVELNKRKDLFSTRISGESDRDKDEMEEYDSDSSEMEEGMMFDKPFFVSSTAPLQPARRARAEVMELRSMMQRDVRDAGPLQTKEWLECGYYKVMERAGQASLAPVDNNPFWADYAEWCITDLSLREQFLSQHVHHAPSTFTNAMFSYALLARSFASPPLPASPVAHVRRYHGLSLNFQAAKPAIIFLQEIRPLESEGTETASAVSGLVRIVDPDNLHKVNPETGDREELTVTESLVKGKPYGLTMVITNMSCNKHQMDIVVPCPEGAIPLEGRPLVDVQTHVCHPYSCLQLHQIFYFPQQGVFDMSPITLVKRGSLLAWLPPPHERVKVVADAPQHTASVSAVKKYSLQWLQGPDASDDDVLLAAGQCTHRLEPAALLWRCCRSANFFQKYTHILRERSQYDVSVWKYALKWKDARGIAEWLSASGTINDLIAAPFSCSLVTMDEHESSLRHREYWPLINPRSHSFAGRVHILNSDLESQWTLFLQFCCRLPHLTSTHLVQAAYYMTVMDRLSEAKELLQRSKAALPNTECTVQREYLEAYLLLCSDATDLSPLHDAVARNSHIRHEKWASMWSALREHLQALDAAPPAVAREGGELEVIEKSTGGSSGTPPATSGGHGTSEFLSIDESRLQEGKLGVTVNSGTTPTFQLSAWAIDVEMMFSTEPFGSSEDSTGALFVQPCVVHSITSAPSGDNIIDMQTAFPGWKTQSLLVEAACGDQKHTVNCFGRNINVMIDIQRGVLVATSRTAIGKTPIPLVAAYVKVFYKSDSSPLDFWKDGYTDRLGRFDYCSTSRSLTSGGERSAKFAILVSSSEFGSSIKQVAPPAFLSK